MITYALPAHLLQAGMSTDDGQDIVAVEVRGFSVSVTVYTPRPDNDEADAHNRSAPETRVYGCDQLVALAVFDDTAVDLSRHPQARRREEGDR